VKRWIQIHRTELCLFLLLWATYAYFYQSTQHSEAARFDQMRAIVEDHTLEINKYWWNSADVIHYPKSGSDHIYPNKAPGMTLVALAPFAVLSLCLSALHLFGLPEWIYWHLIAYVTTIFTVGLLSAVAAILIYRLLRRIAPDDYFAAVIVLAIWLGTMVFPYSTLFFSHQFSGALLAIAFYLLFKISRGDVESDQRQSLYAGGAGLLLGWSVISEYPTVILAALISIYALWGVNSLALRHRCKWKLLGIFIAGGIAAGITLVLYNVAAFGKPFYVAYETYARAGSSFPTYAHGWLGLQLPRRAQFLHALASITVYPQIGILYVGVQGWRVYACNPVLWLALPGLALTISDRSWRAEGMLIAAMTVGYFLFIASYGKSIYDWAGASYLGTRHIIPLSPFLAFPVYFGARRLRVVFYPLLAISIFYMLLATAIEPRVSVPYENPARDFLLPDYLRGNFAQNTAALFGEPRLVTKDSSAFNLGKLLRLPGYLQLTPLLIWWLIAGGALLIATKNQYPVEDRELRPVPGRAGQFSLKISLTLLLLFAAAINLAPIVHHAIASSQHRNHGLLGKYYTNATCTGSPTEMQVDPEIDFDWSKTMPLQPPFSVEWSGNIVVDQPGDYSFALIADDGALLEIDRRTVVDATRVLLQKRTGNIELSAGLHPIRVRYFNLLFGGSVKLFWTRTGRPEQVVPSEVLVPPSPSPTR